MSVEGERRLLRALEIFVACQRDTAPTNCTTCEIGSKGIISVEHHSVCYYLRKIQDADRALANLREFPCCPKEL